MAFPEPTGEIASTARANEPDENFDYVLSFRTKDEIVQETTSCFGMRKKDTSAKVKEKALILKRLRQVGLIYSKVKSADGGEIYYRITANQQRLEEQAQTMGMQIKLKEMYGGGYTEFLINKKELYESAGDRFFTSLQRQSIILDIIENKKRDGGAELNMDREKARGNILSFYPLHDDKTVDQLVASWASFGGAWKSQFINQPLDDVRNYMGESVAIYFTWLSHYTKWLGYSSFVGIIIFIFQVIPSTKDKGAEIFFCYFLGFLGYILFGIMEKKKC